MFDFGLIELIFSLLKNQIPFNFSTIGETIAKKPTKDNGKIENMVIKQKNM